MYSEPFSCLRPPFCCPPRNDDLGDSQSSPPRLSSHIAPSRLAFGFMERYKASLIFSLCNKLFFSLTFGKSHLCDSKFSQGCFSLLVCFQFLLLLQSFQLAEIAESVFFSFFIKIIVFHLLYFHLASCICLEVTTPRMYASFSF